MIISTKFKQNPLTELLLDTHFLTVAHTEEKQLPEMQGLFQATTIFVDISGFTPLTEALMQQEAEGADILSTLLNSLFQPVVSQIYQHGGFITHFAGDAFTAVFEKTDAHAVLNLAFSIQDFFNNSSNLFTSYPSNLLGGTTTTSRQTNLVGTATPSVSTPVGDFKLSVRIGLSHGIVEWGKVGHDNKVPYFKGTAIQRATISQQTAKPNQIVADAWFLEKLDTQHIDYEDISNEYFVLKSIKKEAQPDILQTNIEKNIFQNNFFPAWDIAVKNEFREVIALFFSFQLLNNHVEIDALSRIVLKAFQNYGGYFKELDFSDKYGVMVGFFGAPMAYENSISRALECVLEIQNNLKNEDLPSTFAYRFGLSKGKAYAGMVGGSERSQYAIVGSTVNLAARLMQNAPWGRIYITKELSQNASFEFENMGKHRLKGIGEPIEIFHLLRKKQESTPFFTHKMVGREADLQHLIQFIELNTLKKERGCVATIYGEAGMGKSRLLYEVNHFFKHTLLWATCPADQILRKPLNPFIYFLKNYFHQQLDTTVDANFIAFENRFESLINSLKNTENTEGGELLRTKSVVAALIGLHYDNSLWEQLDAKGRYDNTLVALSSFFIALSSIKPLVIEIEDAHWLDENSTHFLNDFIKKIEQKPIAIVITSRYDDEGKKPFIFDTLSLFSSENALDIDLNFFTKENLESLAKLRLQGSVHPELVETLWRTSNGNPFYAEQILGYLIENNIIQNIDNQFIVLDTTIKVSNSLSSILTARIDRLSSILKETIKAAAVIGREFELPILTEIMLSHNEYIKHNGDSASVLQEQIHSAEKGQIWQAMNELRYIFKHTLLREAVYDMQLKTQLRTLHATTAKAIEKVYADNLEDRFIDLAFHYEQAGLKEKTRYYLKQAADKTRRLFQNQQALDLYERLLQNTENQEDRIKTKIRRGEVLQLIGQWQDAEKQYQEALNDARHVENPELKGRTHNALGQLLMLKGNYKDADYHLARGADNFEKIIDFQGIVRAYGNMGNLYFRQGVYDKAEDYFTKSISLAREQNIKSQAQVVANLGLTYMNQGKYTEGVRCQMEELAICEKNNDLGGMATLSVNIGIVWLEEGSQDKALKSLEKGLNYAKSLGNKQLISIALGCIGSIWLDKKNIDIAEQYLLQDLSITEELGDKQGIAIASELLGRLYLAKQNYDNAIQYFDVSLSLCKTLNYQKGLCKTLIGLGNTYLEKSEIQYALKCFNEAWSTSKNIHNIQLSIFSLIGQYRVYTLLKDAQNTEGVLKLLKKEADFSDSFQIKNQIQIFFKSIQ